MLGVNTAALIQSSYSRAQNRRPTGRKTHRTHRNNFHDGRKSHLTLTPGAALLCTDNEWHLTSFPAAVCLGPGRAGLPGLGCPQHTCHRSAPAGKRGHEPRRAGGKWPEPTRLTRFRFQLAIKTAPAPHPGTCLQIGYTEYQLLIMPLLNRFNGRKTSAANT